MAMAVGTVLVVNGEIDVRSCKLYREIAGIQLGASLTVCHTVVFLHGYFIGEGFAHCGKFGGGNDCAVCALAQNAHVRHARKRDRGDRQRVAGEFGGERRTLQ